MAAAPSEPCPASAAATAAPAPAEAASTTDHRLQREAAAQASDIPSQHTCSSHDQSVLRRRRDAVGDACGGSLSCQGDGGDVCAVPDAVPDKSAAPLSAASPAASLTAPGGNGGNGYVQGKSQPCPQHGLQEQHDAKLNLLTFHDVPPHLRFNPYIVTGYRPMSDFWGSLRSLFYLHNETVNIVTHGIPIVYILLVVPGLMPWSRLDPHGRFLAWCHLVGAVSPWVGSFVYHLFMNLQAGEQVYNRLLRLDMFGIWICQSFGALPMVTATVYCLPWNVRWLIIGSYCLLSLCGLYKAMTAWSPWDRRLSFALPWLSRLFLCVLRAFLGGGSPHNMLHLILQDGVSLVGGVVGAVYFPEKYFPGMVDYCLNSHNIMHVLTVAAVYSMHCATVQDLEWITSVDCKPAGPPWPPWSPWTGMILGTTSQTEL
ncbi:progestin and adipoQ receptor family member 4 [Thrips palmi]|uniref:Progestin and adipoQ receptor family member 4 n=1 Tax=Thrips palmi TaxID=161013 RepID=A0A6P9A0M5_THRPL|nr:progestin and adipoQ receptor family member 4 [Thrips palmi]